MTTFIDGPAAGQHLMLKNAPQTLRVVRDKVTGKWDALDAPGDTPRESEDVFEYERAELTGGAFVDYGGKKKAASGFYPIASYRLAKKTT